MSVTEEKYKTLGLLGFTGPMPERELQWLQGGGATSDDLEQAWKESLEAYAGGPILNYQRNTAWYDFLGTLGLTGSLVDREYKFWKGEGVVPAPAVQPLEATQFALSTAAAGGTQDVTIEGIGTPQAAIFIVSGAAAADTITEDGSFGWGFTDGTSQAACTTFSEEAVGTANTCRAHRVDRVIMSLVNKTEVGGFSFNSWITDGVRLDIDVAATVATVVTCIFIGGDGVLNAKVGVLGLGSGTSAIDVNTLGFEPTLVNTINSGQTFVAPSTDDHAIIGIGFGINDGADTQRCMSYSSRDARGTGTVSSYVSNNAVSAQSFDGSLSWRATIGDYDSSGFSITPATSAGGDQLFYLAVEFAPTVSIALIDITIPISGDYTETSLSFLPGTGLLMCAPGTNSRNTTDSGSVGTLATAVFDATNIYTSCMTDQDGVSPIISKSMFDTSFNILHHDGSTTSIEASGWSMEANGWDFPLTTNPAQAVLGCALAVAL